MKYPTLVSELSDEINKLPDNTDLQTLLIKARKEIMEQHKTILNTPQEEDKTAFKKQVNNEVQRLVSKMKK